MKPKLRKPNEQEEEILDLLNRAKVIATNPKGLRPLVKEIINWHFIKALKVKTNKL